MRSGRGFLWFIGPAVIFALLFWGLWLWSRVAESTEVPVVGVAIGAIVSGLILFRKPGNPIGLLLLAAGLVGSLQVVSEGYWVVDLGTSNRSVAAAMAAKTTAVAGTLGFSMILVFLPILFPTGRPHAPWSAWLFRGAFLLVTVQAAGIALSGQDVCILTERSGRCLERWIGPPGLDWLPNPAEPPVTYVFGALILASIIGGLWAAVARYWRAVGVERLQMKWFAFAASLSLMVIPAGIVYTFPAWIFNIPFSLLPTGIGVAILRYRLYDIDRIVSRTLSYGIVVGLLALVFAAGVVWIPSLVPGLGDSSVLVAGSTLTAAALFNPLRRRVQSQVDRRFNRSRYDAERVMEDFAGSLKDRVDPEGVLRGWTGVVTETVQPVAVGVWVRG